MRAAAQGGEERAEEARAAVAQAAVAQAAVAQAAVAQAGEAWVAVATAAERAPGRRWARRCRCITTIASRLNRGEKLVAKVRAGERSHFDGTVN